MNKHTAKNDNRLFKLRNLSTKQALMLLIMVTMLSIIILGLLNFYFNKKLLNVQAKSQSTAVAIQNINQMFTVLLAREMQIYNAATQENLNAIQYKVTREEYAKNRDKLVPLQDFDSKAKTLLEKLDVQYGNLIALDINAMDSRAFFLNMEHLLKTQKDQTLQQSEKIIALANSISGKYTLTEKREKRGLIRLINKSKANLEGLEINKIFDQTLKVLKSNTAAINSNANNINISLVKLTSNINAILGIENVDLLTSLINNHIVQNFKTTIDALKVMNTLAADNSATLAKVKGLLEEVEKLKMLVLVGDSSIFTLKKNMLNVSTTLNQTQEHFLTIMANTLTTLKDVGSISEHLRNATTKETETILQRSKSVNVFAILTIFLILYLSSVMFAQYIKNGIDKIGVLVRQVANFDLTAKINTKELPTNEIGMILKDVVNMVGSLSKIISNMIANAGKLTNLSEELDKSSTSSVTDIKKQKTETEQIATATNEMAYSSADVAKSAKVMDETIQSTVTVVTTAREKIADSIDLVNNLSNKLLESSDIISKVDQQSQNISSVLDVITNITEQTNLLALNAAIEAARAGEHGRGFAVVADEVRELAKRSKSSADEIRTIISALQQQSTIAVKDMTDSFSVSKNCVQINNELGEIVENVKTAIMAVMDNVIQIAAATKQQNDAVQGTNTSVQYLSTSMDGALENANANYQISKQMANVSGEIQDTTNMFKVG